MITEHRLILFDAVCPLCAGFVRFVLHRDGRAIFRFVSVQSAFGQEVLARFDLPLTGWESNVLVEDGRALLKSDAYIAIMRHLPAPWRWLTVLRAIPRPLRDWAYDRVANNRYRIFGKYDRCIVPTPDIAGRFLE